MREKRVSKNLGRFWVNRAALLVAIVVAWLPRILNKEVCTREYPYMGVGDFNLTQRNVGRIISENEYLLVQVTSTKMCPDCCKYEKVLDEFNTKVLKSTNSSLFKHNIKLARADYQEGGWFADDYDVPMLPYLLFIIKGKTLYFKDPKDLNRVAINLERHIEPIVELHSMRMVQDFLKGTVKDISGRVLVRSKALCLISDKDDFEEILEEYHKTALLMSWREDMAFGLVSRVKIIKEIRKEYGTKFFPDSFDLNAVAIYRNKNRFEDADQVVLLDMTSNKVKSVGRWIAENSLGAVEELNSLNEGAYSIALPILIAFCEPRKQAETDNFLRGYRNLAKYYEREINFVWVDFNDNLNLMKRLGVFRCELPCVGLKVPEHKNRLHILKTPKHTMENIAIFLRKYKDGELDDHSQEVRSALTAQAQKLSVLQNTSHLKFSQFIFDVLKTDQDSLVFVHDPTSALPQRVYSILNQISIIFDRVFNVDTLRVYSYDISEIRMHDYFYTRPGFEVNTFHLFGGGEEKDVVHPMYEGQSIDGNSLLMFVLENIKNKFRLPEFGTFKFSGEARSLGFDEEALFGALNSRGGEVNKSEDPKSDAGEL